MALPDQWISRLRGTMGNLLGIGGTGGVNLQNSSGKLIVRNAANSANATAQVGSLEIKDTGSANVIVFNAPTLAGNVTFTLPQDDGTPGQFLSTDGSGVLSWASSNSNADITDATSFDQASGTLAMFTPPANAVIRKITCIVDVAAAAGSPTLVVGIAGTTNKYMEATDNDMKVASIFETQPEYLEDGTPDAIIATVVASAQTFSGRLYVTYSVPA